MLGGINLSMLMGPVVPVPVPPDVINAVSSIEITTASGTSQSGFRLTFSINTGSILQQIFLLAAGGGAAPKIRIVLMININGSTEVLMDGVVLNYQTSAGNKPGETLLTVMGKDLTALMDIIDFDGIPYPAIPPEVRVLTILGKYAVLGLIPVVIPAILNDLSLPLERIPQQKGTDLAYVKFLAEQAGYVFYLDPGPKPGMNLAYWGPEIKTGKPQPALSINMDAQSNSEPINFTFDKELAEIPIIYIQNEETKMPIPIPIPDISPLNPPLGLISAIPPKLKYMKDTAKLKPAEAILKGMAFASQHSDTVTGTGSLDMLRYGNILKPRKLVGVRGAGMLYDGLYYVKSVTHSIKPGEYKQSFTLTRNGVISTVPSVLI